MFQTHLPSDKPKRNHRFLPLLSGLLVVAVLAAALVFSIQARNGAHAASAAAATNAAVAYADSHWNCGDPSCSYRVSAGSPQPNFQCAEFVSRSLAAEGKVPGLNPNSPQSSYGSYHAKNGKVYDLLWVGVDASGYNDEGTPGLYQYLTENKVGTNIGNHPSQAAPGDVTFYFEGQGHTGVLVQTGSTPLIDAHNNAAYHVYYTEGYSTIIVHIGGSSNSEEDVFWKGTDNNLWHAFWTNKWNGAFKIGMGPLNSPPAVASLAGGEEDVFWKGTDNNLWHAFWTNKWNGPFDLGMGPLGSAPTVAVVR